MAEKIELKAFKIALSKDEKRRVRDMLVTYRNASALMISSRNGVCLSDVTNEHTENIVNFIESLIIDNKPDVPF